MKRLVLASASPRRLDLLRDMGIVPDAIVSADIEEKQMRGEHPRAMSIRLAREKAQAVVGMGPGDGAFVLAGDTVVARGLQALPKAGDADDVRRFLRLLSGRRHHVYSALCLVAPDGRLYEQYSDSVVLFKRLTDADIDAYVASGEGVGKAGGYAIQGRAGTLIRWIAGSYSGIVGLPVFEAASLLRRAGVMS